MMSCSKAICCPVNAQPAIPNRTASASERRASQLFCTVSLTSTVSRSRLGRPSWFSTPSEATLPVALNRSDCKSRGFKYCYLLKQWLCKVSSPRFHPADKEVHLTGLFDKRVSAHPQEEY